jgi:thioredoxin reductase
METEVLIVGGGFAGMAAALYLGRARRQVVLCDAGQGRNRFAAHAQGFLGMDGLAPQDVRARGRADLAAYPSVRVIDGQIGTVEGRDGAFVAAGPQGAIRARKVILASGMRDILPDLPGLAACWGQTAIQCPYCHGFELADRPTALILFHPASLHQAAILPSWTDDLTVCTQGVALTADDRARLDRAGTRVEEARVVAIDHAGGQVTGLFLQDGRRLPCGVVYLAARHAPASPLATALGCAMDDGPFGPHVRVDGFQATSVPGVLAAGDLTRPFYGATLAAADGVRAALAAHAGLVAL